ncbi:MAG: alanyl-tRNA editing protein, partial [Candidatus Bathyarchaeota archaeon]|nr:alanyl-tRNA editing protein [Candidatus Bathyarchaeota archaeon]
MVLQDLDIARFASDLNPTSLLFLEDSYLVEFKAVVLRSSREKRRSYICLDRTIFHPRMGGQPNDEGFLEYVDGRIHIDKVFISGGVIVHVGSIVEGDIPRVGETIYGWIDWLKRYRIMRRHTAGHLLDYCISKILSKPIHTVDVWMGDPCYTIYDECIDVDDISSIEYEANSIIRSDRNVYAIYMDFEELQHLYPNAPNLYRIPRGLEKYRIVVIDGYNGIPCT